MNRFINEFIIANNSLGVLSSLERLHLNRNLTKLKIIRSNKFNNIYDVMSILNFMAKNLIINTDCINVFNICVHFGLKYEREMRLDLI